MTASSSRAADAWSVRPLAPAVGAEIKGLDLASLDDDALEALEHAERERTYHTDSDVC